jgi:hypothetical protein
MAYKTSVIQYFFYFGQILNFKLKKKVQNTILGKLYLSNIKGTHGESLPTLEI